MLTNSDTSNDTDISAHQQGLVAALEGDRESGGSRQDETTAPSRAATVVAQPAVPPSPPTSGSDFTTTTEQAQRALETLDYLYRLEYRQGTDAAFDDLPSLAAELKATGEILDHCVAGSHLLILFATAIDPEVIGALVELPDHQVTSIAPEDLSGPHATQQVATDMQPPESMATAEEPATVAGMAPEAMLIANDAAAQGPLVDVEEGLFEEEEEGSQDSLWAEDGFAAEEVETDRAFAHEGDGDLEGTEVDADELAPLIGPVVAAPQLPAPPAPAVSTQEGSLPPIRPMATERNLRVRVELLDELMNLAGELVLTRNQLIQQVEKGDLSLLEGSTQRLDHVTTDLQETIVSTRMQPVGTVFGKFRRIVRDLSATLGKSVDLQIEGEDVELDKTIIEALGDPLTHLIRNSMDHGIEVSQIRRERGKSVPAKLCLRAIHQAGQVLIEISDDGAGIDPERIRDKAMSLGLYDRAELDAMGERDVLRLVFHPGFSTKEEVTDMSGRGVGMDVVHTNLTRLGGVVDIESEPGVGTTVRISLPLTLAIIPSLLISIGTDQFAIPQDNLAELVRVPAAQREQRIEWIDKAQVLRLRGRLLPLISLREILGIDEHSTHDQAVYVAVLKAGDLRFGLIVDELLDSKEIVVKPLDSILGKTGIYAGGTILGDGTVALILDVIGLRHALDLEVIDGLPPPQEIEEAFRSDAQQLLLVENAPGEQCAIPMKLVSRIERISAEQIEQSGGRSTLQYRGSHLVLMSLEQAADVQPLIIGETMFVIIFRVAGGEIGLLTSDVLDIVIGVYEVTTKGFLQPGIGGSTIIDGRSTLMVDLYGLVRKVDPVWVEEQTKDLHGDATILLAEDTPFFREQMRRCLEGAGYQLHIAEDGERAWELLEEHGDQIDIVVSDVEMPRLDGLSLVRRIRDDERFAHLPVAVVTSLSDEADEQRGKEAGVDAYLIKLDQEQLLQAVSGFLRRAEAS
ncbi:MAG: response regulator [Gemmatimonadetes bacterium]|nr:response regulator [Gemmatimonadota bacterium]